MKMNENLTTKISAKTQSMIEKYTAELQRRLEEKLNFVNALSPVLEKYQTSGETFTTWRLGKDAFGEEFAISRSYANYGRGREDRTAIDKANSYSVRVGAFLSDLRSMGIIEDVTKDYAAPSSSKVYKFVE